MATEDLTPWLNRVKKAGSRQEVFAILDDFRKLEWTDEQSSSMAKLYIRVLDRVVDAGSEQESAKAAVTQSEDNGPVWYEKM